MVELLLTVCLVPYPPDSNVGRAALPVATPRKKVCVNCATPSVTTALDLAPLTVPSVWIPGVGVGVGVCVCVYLYVVYDSMWLSSKVVILYM